MSSFLEDLNRDLAESFFSENDFGEKVTLLRGSQSYELNALFDTPELASDSLGVEIEPIAHTNRLFVRASDLPDGKPRKGDRFTLGETPFHSSISLAALDFVFEKDGTVVYRLKDCSNGS